MGFDQLLMNTQTGSLVTRPKKDFTRLAVTSEPKVQITRNKNPVKDIAYMYDIIENSYQNFVLVSQKQIVKIVAFLLTHAVLLYTLKSYDKNYFHKTQQNWMTPSLNSFEFIYLQS